MVRPPPVDRIRDGPIGRLLGVGPPVYAAWDSPFPQTLASGEDVEGEIRGRGFWGREGRRTGFRPACSAGTASRTGQGP